MLTAACDGSLTGSVSCIPPFMPMFAHGENLIGQILLLLLCYVAFITLSIWTFLNSPRPELRRSVVRCAVLVSIVGGVGTCFMLKEIVLDFPNQELDLDDVVGILFWAFPIVCGVGALVRAQRAKLRSSDSTVSKV